MITKYHKPDSTLANLLNSNCSLFLPVILPASRAIEQTWCLSLPWKAGHPSQTTWWSLCRSSCPESQVWLSFPWHWR